MTDKIQKFLTRLPKDQLIYLRLYLDKVRKDDTKDLNIKPLKGYKGVYRVRVGKYRIVFRPLGNNEAEILLVGKRDDQTYRDF